MLIQYINLSPPLLNNWTLTPSQSDFPTTQSIAQVSSTF